MMANGKKTGVDHLYLIALSGGMDSTIAAWLLQQEGYRLTGVYLQISGEDEEIAKAEKAAQFLKIPLNVLDFREEFESRIIRPFISAYISGQTPNPCVLCNAEIKCGLLLEWALREGFNKLITGHYARIKKGPDSKSCYLLRGRDIRRDQSYFLYRLTQEKLRRLIFPLGTWEKRDVAALAQRIGFSVETIKGSQEICFLHSRDYRDFLKEMAPHAFSGGPVYDKRGNLLGSHQGLPCYTIGQRKGLNLCRPGPDYVLSLDTMRNRLIVGKAEELLQSAITSDKIHRLVSPWPHSVMAQIRSTQPAQEADIEELADARIRLSFNTPVRAASPGQSVVLYSGDMCIGGGIIESSSQY